MTTPDYVLHRNLQFLRDERAEAGAVEHAGHADYPVLAELGDPERRLRHGVERIGDHDDDAVRRVFGDLLGGGADHVVVGEQKVVAAHAGFTGKAGGNDCDIGIGGGLVVVGPGEHHVVALNRAGLQEVETFTLRNTLHDVHQDDIGEFLVRNAQRAIRADVSGAHNGDFLSQG